MKRLVFSSLLILVASFVPCLAETQQGSPVPEITNKEEPLSKHSDIKDFGGNSMGQSDVSEGKARTVPEVEAGWKALNQQAQKETRAWTRDGAGWNKGKLAEVVQAQVVAELNFIRKAAVEEGATKIVEAIDRVLEARKERFGNITEKLQIEGQRMSRGERDDRATRGGQQRQRGNRQPRRARQSRQRGR